MTANTAYITHRSVSPLGPVPVSRHRGHRPQLYAFYAFNFPFSPRKLFTYLERIGAAIIFDAAAASAGAAGAAAYIPQTRSASTSNPEISDCFSLLYSLS